MKNEEIKELYKGLTTFGQIVKEDGHLFQGFPFFTFNDKNIVYTVTESSPQEKILNISSLLDDPFKQPIVNLSAVGAALLRLTFSPEGVRGETDIVTFNRVETVQLSSSEIDTILKELNIDGFKQVLKEEIKQDDNKKEDPLVQQVVEPIILKTEKEDPGIIEKIIGKIKTAQNTPFVSQENLVEPSEERESLLSLGGILNSIKSLRQKNTETSESPKFKK